MLIDRLLHQPAPLLMLLLGVLVMGVSRTIAHDRGLSYVAAGFILTSTGLGLQTLMDDRLMTVTAPAIAVLYLAGALSTTTAVAMRCGDGRGRIPFSVAVAGLCLLGSGWFALVAPDMFWRMVILNAAMTLIYAAQLPYLWRDWGRLGFWDRMMGLANICIAVFHLLRVVYLVGNGFGGGDYNRTAEQLVASLEWRVILIGFGVMSLVFCFVSVICAVQDRFDLLMHERDLDPLTGLLNRRGFAEQAQARVAAAPDLIWTVIAGDIDNFKAINDVWGHATGDEVLVRVAAVWAGAARPRHLAARFGGEEFIMLTANRNLQEANDRAEEMRQIIGMTLVPGLPEHVTMSFGVAQVFMLEGAGVAQALDRALAMADACLYRAKANGRNCVVTEGRPPDPLSLRVR